jgi:hypothetical protein
MEHKQENNNDLGYTLSGDGTKLINVTDAALDKNGRFTIPDSVTSIEGLAFYECTSLTTVHIPEGVTSIQSSAFSGCRSLTTVHIPNGVTSIGYAAFEACTSLTTVHIPDSVTSIVSWAFRNCTSLTSIIIETDDEDELNRIKNLLPMGLRGKVISHSVYNIQREIAERYAYAAVDTTLNQLGLLVEDVNKIIASYLPEYVDRISEILNTVDRPVFSVNVENLNAYRARLTQVIKSRFPGVFAGHQAVEPSDRKQSYPDASVPAPIAYDDNLEFQPMRGENQFDQVSESAEPSDQKTPEPAAQPHIVSTATLFSPAPQEHPLSDTPGAVAQSVLSTRGQRSEEPNPSCCTTM